MTSQSSRHALVGWALTVLGVLGTAGLAGGTGAGSTAAEHVPAELLVFAAASLSETLDEVGRAFTARTGVRVNASYAASSVLAKQIEADLVASALEHFRKRPALGFSDCLVLEIARKAGHLPLGTFARNLARLGGAERL